MCLQYYSFLVVTAQVDNPKDVRARDVTRFETVVTADSTDRRKCSIKTSNRDVSFRKFIL